MEATQKHMYYKAMIVSSLGEVERLLNAAQPKHYSVSSIEGVGFLVVVRLSKKRHYR